MPNVQKGLFWIYGCHSEKNSVNSFVFLAEDTVEISKQDTVPVLQMSKTLDQFEVNTKILY